MPLTTIFFGLVLTALGAYGYLSPSADKVSITALIPAFVGVPLMICGFLALKASARKHAMHVAAAIGLLGALMAGYRGLTKIGTLVSSDPQVNKRPIVFVLAMAVICAIFVGLCVKSFIDARRRRQAA